MQQEITFVKHPRIAGHAVTLFRKYRSKCKRYRLSQHVSKIKGRNKPRRRKDPETGEYHTVPGELRGYPTVWYAEFLDGRSWKIISTHKTRGAAEKACRKYEEERCD